MSRKGCSPYNAACEGFFGRLKTEWFYPGNWQSTTVAPFTQAFDSYIRWYNEKRIKMSLGARSLIDYRRSLGLTASTVQVFSRIPRDRRSLRLRKVCKIGLSLA
jgi:putative transposase